MEIRIPEIGESVHEATVAKWLKNSGDVVTRDEPLCEIETDKITLELNAEVAGVLSIRVAQGSTVAVGTCIGEIAEQAVAGSPSSPVAPASLRERAIMDSVSSPEARRRIREAGIHPQALLPSGKNGRILANDVTGSVRERQQRESERIPHLPDVVSAVSLPLSLDAVAQPVGTASGSAPSPATGRSEERVPLSPIRRRIAQRLLAARQQTAMLTTFGEADMSGIASLRATYREYFLQAHGVTLGLMPFFVRACIRALREYPLLNARIDGDDIVHQHYYDIGIAVGGEKGVVVPVIRDADQLRMFQIQQAIAGFVDRVRHNRLSIADLEGGTFTISNGGVYGSLLSTPILNPPQSGVLGMHGIQERPVVRDGQIVIRPMMYLALSYDHRIVDGREAAGFLRRVQE